MSAYPSILKRGFVFYCQISPGSKFDASRSKKSSSNRIGDNMLLRNIHAKHGDGGDNGSRNTKSRGLKKSQQNGGGLMSGLRRLSLHSGKPAAFPHSIDEEHYAAIDQNEDGNLYNNNFYYYNDQQQQQQQQQQEIFPPPMEQSRPPPARAFKQRYIVLKDTSLFIQHGKGDANWLEVLHLEDVLEVRHWDLGPGFVLYAEGNREYWFRMPSQQGLPQISTLLYSNNDLSLSQRGQQQKQQQQQRLYQREQELDRGFVTAANNIEMPLQNHSSSPSPSKSKPSKLQRRFTAGGRALIGYSDTFNNNNNSSSSKKYRTTVPMDSELSFKVALTDERAREETEAWMRVLHGVIAPAELEELDMLAAQRERHRLNGVFDEIENDDAYDNLENDESTDEARSMHNKTRNNVNSNNNNGKSKKHSSSQSTASTTQSQSAAAAALASHSHSRFGQSPTQVIRKRNDTSPFVVVEHFNTKGLRISGPAPLKLLALLSKNMNAARKWRDARGWYIDRFVPLATVLSLFDVFGWSLDTITECVGALPEAELHPARAMTLLDDTSTAHPSSAPKRKPTKNRFRLTNAELGAMGFGGANPLSHTAISPASFKGMADNNHVMTSSVPGAADAIQPLSSSAASAASSLLLNNGDFGAISSAELEKQCVVCSMIIFSQREPQKLDAKMFSSNNNNAMEKVAQKNDNFGLGGGNRSIASHAHAPLVRTSTAGTAQSYNHEENIVANRAMSANTKKQVSNSNAMAVQPQMQSLRKMSSMK